MERSAIRDSRRVVGPPRIPLRSMRATRSPDPGKVPHRIRDPRRLKLAPCTLAGVAASMLDYPRIAYNGRSCACRKGHTDDQGRARADGRMTGADRVRGNSGPGYRDGARPHRRAHEIVGRLPGRHRRRSQHGSRARRHHDERQSGVDLHHQRHVPLSRLHVTARQGQRLPLHLHWAGGYLADHRRHQRRRSLPHVDRRLGRQGRALGGRHSRRSAARDGP